jgi:succinate dehydrogenase (ubiquinone) cytochrome b560 subunit
MTILSKESASEFQKSNYTQRMAATHRPVSPHVTIYSFPICALTSIATRVTGCMLSFGSAGLGAVELIGGNGAAFELMSNLGTVGGGNCATLAALGSLGMIVPAVSKFAVAFPLGYHYLGGVRHCIWDNSPNMLENVGVEKASYVLIGTSLLLGGAAVVV